MNAINNQNSTSLYEKLLSYAKDGICSISDSSSSSSEEINGKG